MGGLLDGEPVVIFLVTRPVDLCGGEEFCPTCQEFLKAIRERLEELEGVRLEQMTEATVLILPFSEARWGAYEIEEFLNGKLGRWVRLLQEVTV